jgi:hypothetical protein
MGLGASRTSGPSGSGSTGNVAGAARTPTATSKQDTPPPSPRSNPVQAPTSRTSSKPTPIDPSLTMPLSPFSGINMAVSPSNPVPTGTERIPTVFNWAHGGKSVFVTGTWNNWKDMIPLRRSEHDFTAILELPPGLHQYKFIVDGKWRHAPEQPVAADSKGNLNNCMEVKEFRLERKSLKEKGSPPGSYSQEIPEGLKPSSNALDELFDDNDFIVASPPRHSANHSNSKKVEEPPTLPPHLFGKRAVLNTTTTEDPTVLPLPNHVMLNHLYFKQYEDSNMADILILGTTQRYKEKFVTTVFYMPKPEPQKDSPSTSTHETPPTTSISTTATTTTTATPTITTTTTAATITTGELKSSPSPLQMYG